MKIGIIGLGMVGGALRHGFTRLGHEVKGYDIKYPETSLRDVLKTDILFISVPTPQAKGGSCDTSIVEKVVADIAKAEYRGLLTIKSTIEPGTTDRLAKKYKKLRFAFCPEFLRERAMYVDFVENHDVCIIGAYTKKDYELLKKAHDPLLHAYAHVTPLEAEFTKYFSNVFNALRITFANQFYDVCKKAGADYQNVKRAIVHRKNIPDFYLDCNENFRGFGGACLPKDTSAFAAYVQKLGLDIRLFRLVVEENKRYKPTVF